MTQLVTEGFLEQVPKHGFFVKTLSRKELAELFDIRLLLEGYAVEKATDAITPKRLAELESLTMQWRVTSRRFGGEVA